MYLITIGPSTNIGLATMQNGERLALSTARSVEINDKECESIEFVRSTTCDDVEYVTIFVITPWSFSKMNGTFTSKDEIVSAIKSGQAMEDGEKLRIVHGSRSATLFGIKEAYAITYVIGKCDTTKVEEWLAHNRPIEEQWINGEWQWNHDEMMTEFCDELREIEGEWRSFWNNDMPVL